MKKQENRIKKEKRPYTKPLLTPYGGIAELTQTKAGNCQDNTNAFNNAEVDCVS